MPWRTLWLPIATTLLAGCTHLVPIVPMGGGSLSSSSALDVTARSPGSLDPLRVAGSYVVYGDLQTALEQAVLGGAAAWTGRHRAARPSSYSLGVELIHAEAEYARGRLGIALVVRATLRLRSGNEFLGQTQAVCREAKLVHPADGGPVVYRCMQRLGRNLGGWLDDVAP